MKFFTNIENLKELKEKYRELAFTYHPDKGGDVEAMQLLNNQYQELFKKLQKKSNDKHEQAEDSTKYSDLIVEIIEKISIITQKNISFEVIGTWLYISGNDTKEIKEQLKELNFHWAKVKKAWYNNFIDGYVPNRKKGETMAESRAKFKSKKGTIKPNGKNLD